MGLLNLNKSQWNKICKQILNNSHRGLFKSKHCAEVFTRLFHLLENHEKLLLQRWFYPGVNLLVPIDINLSKDMHQINLRDWFIGRGHSSTPAGFFDLLYQVDKLAKLNVINLPAPVNRNI